MNVFFGKISAKIDTKQIEEGYYAASKGGTWFNGIEIGDYAYVIGGSRIQLWKAEEWTTDLRDGVAIDRLNFEILIPDIGLSIKEFVAFKYLFLTIDLIVKTTRSTGGEKKAFFKIDIDSMFSESDLLNSDTYLEADNFREIKVSNAKQDLIADSYDLQLYFKDSELFLSDIKNGSPEVVNKFVNNLDFIGKGQPMKDNTLAIIKAIGNIGKPLGSRISIKDVYDAFMCKYSVEDQNTKYWVLNGYDQEKISYDLENDQFVMYYQYGTQGKGDVTKHLNKVTKIRPGDKVLLFNQNKYYGHSTFEKCDFHFTKQITLKNLVTNNHFNKEGDVVLFTDAECFYEDLRLDNGFSGKWGQRLNIDLWENSNPDGVFISGIKHQFSGGVIQDTILELKDKTFYNMVTGILSGEIENINDYQQMKVNIDLLKYKKQIILQGPPGTGKTYMAKKIVKELVGSLDSDQFKLIQFHPSYSYEDFVRGITAESNDNGQVEYSTKNKVFGEFIERANKAKKLFDDPEALPYMFAEYLENQIRGNKEFYFDSDQTIRFKDIKYHKDKPMLRYEEYSESQGDWKMETWIDMVDSFGLDTYEKSALKQSGSYGSVLINTSWSKIKQAFYKFAYPFVGKKEFVLIIDEINRANLPSVLGELIYALEYRGEAVESMYAIDGDNSLTIPDNLYIIGTMNTADRSVGSIDYAIKRRFAFVDVLPNVEVITYAPAKALFVQISKLFDNEYLASDFDKKEVQLGHSYFILEEGNDAQMKSELEMKLKYEIKPILREYVKDGLLIGKAEEIIEKLTVSVE